jgi:nicotinamidase-related amidase
MPAEPFGAARYGANPATHVCAAPIHPLEVCVSYPDPLTDRLLTAENATLLILDFQPSQIRVVTTMDPGRLVENAVLLCRAAKLFGLPMIFSTLKTGHLAEPPVDPVREIAPDAPRIGRTALNPWEDDRFLDAVAATGRRKLVFAAPWSETALSFAVISAILDGYETYIVRDAIGGTSALAQAAALSRMSEMGANQTSCVQLLCELQRDGRRTATLDAFGGLLSAILRHS